MLIPVEAQNVKKVWPLVKVYVQRAIDRSPWPIELGKVLSALQEDGAYKLFLLSSKGDFYGAGILCIYEEFGVKVMNIYSMSYDPGYPENELDFAQVEGMAQAAGCDVISFYGRPGFKKTLSKLGLKEAQTIMVKEV